MQIVAGAFHAVTWSKHSTLICILCCSCRCADFVLLNKMDQLDTEKLASLTEIVRTLNPIAQVQACELGRVDIRTVFGPEVTGLVARMNTEGQHRGAVAAAKALTKEAHGHDKGHDHAHELEHNGHEHKDHGHEHKDHGHEHKDHEHEHEHKDHNHEGHDHGHEVGRRQRGRARP